MHDEEGHKDWSMVHAFYAVMGGFVVDSNEESPLYPECAQRKRITLSPTGVQYIAEHHSHLLPHVEEAEVRDKSKANALAKFLVCIQAGWFVLQCISRMVLSLPITLLEVRWIQQWMFGWMLTLRLAQHLRSLHLCTDHLHILVEQATGCRTANANQKQRGTRLVRLLVHEFEGLPTFVQKKQIKQGRDGLSDDHKRSWRGKPRGPSTQIEKQPKLQQDCPFRNSRAHTRACPPNRWYKTQLWSGCQACDQRDEYNRVEERSNSFRNRHQQPSRHHRASKRRYSPLDTGCQHDESCSSWPQQNWEHRCPTQPQLANHGPRPQSPRLDTTGLLQRAQYLIRRSARPSLECRICYAKTTKHVAIGLSLRDNLCPGLDIGTADREPSDLWDRVELRGSRSNAQDQQVHVWLANLAGASGIGFADVSLGEGFLGCGELPQFGSLSGWCLWFA